MTPKEKANDLVNKFMQYIPAEEKYELPYAIKNALIAVDEILLATALETKGRFEFYLEVKKEIELL